VICSRRVELADFLDVVLRGSAADQRHNSAALHQLHHPPKGLTGTLALASPSSPRANAGSQQSLMSRGSLMRCCGTRRAAGDLHHPARVSHPTLAERLIRPHRALLNEYACLPRTERAHTMVSLQPAFFSCSHTNTQTHTHTHTQTYTQLQDEPIHEGCSPIQVPVTRVFGAAFCAACSSCSRRTPAKGAASQARQLARPLAAAPRAGSARASACSSCCTCRHASGSSPASGQAQSRGRRRRAAGGAVGLGVVGALAKPARLCRIMCPFKLHL
jgi:hypothetical protein